MSLAAETDIIKGLKSLMADTFGFAGTESISDSASMSTLSEWDSLAHVELLVGIKNKYGIEISPNEIGFTLTVPDLVAFIRSKLDGNKTFRQVSIAAGLSCDALVSKLFAYDDLRLGDTIYIHSSAKKLISVCSESLFEVYRLLKGDERSQRTIVFPAFAFTGESYSRYIEKTPRFSVKDTSVMTGLFPEVMRAEQNVYRSYHPLLSEYAIGPNAMWITKDAHIDPHPFHEKSTYSRLIALDAAMIGLGVDINTNAIIHMVDDKFRFQYPFDIYLNKPLRFEIELPDSTVIEKEFIAYSPDVLKKIKPRKLRPYFKDSPHIVNEFEINGIWFYMLRIKPFLEKCMDIAGDCLKSGKLPPWYG